MNWDDMKYFLAVCRAGSIRSAAKTLGVNHATVSRRINQFETSLNMRLFERNPKGYSRTKAGEQIYQDASYLEERLNTVERRAMANDANLCGEIRVTTPDVIAQCLIMDDIADFSHLHPDIDIEVIDSARSFNLTNREADVAIRICNDPPEHLVGRKLAAVHRACYVNPATFERCEASGDYSALNWIGWTDKMRRPVGEIAHNYPRFASKHRIVSAVLQAQACRLGMGVAILPCFMADLDPQLVRIPPYSSEHKFDLWILSHPDMRKHKRIQLFVRFITERILAKRALLEGELFESDTF